MDGCPLNRAVPSKTRAAASQLKRWRGGAHRAPRSCHAQFPGFVMEPQSSQHRLASGRMRIEVQAPHRRTPRESTPRSTPPPGSRRPSLRAAASRTPSYSDGKNKRKRRLIQRLEFRVGQPSPARHDAEGAPSRSECIAPWQRPLSFGTADDPPDARPKRSGQRGVKRGPARPGNSSTGLGTSDRDESNAPPRRQGPRRSKVRGVRPRRAPCGRRFHGITNHAGSTRYRSISRAARARKLRDGQPAADAVRPTRCIQEPVPGSGTASRCAPEENRRRPHHENVQTCRRLQQWRRTREIDEPSRPRGDERQQDLLPDMQNSWSCDRSACTRCDGRFGKHGAKTGQSRTQRTARTTGFGIQQTIPVPRRCIPPKRWHAGRPLGP